MDAVQIIWIIVAIAVVLVIIGIIARIAGSKRKDRNREEAGRMRAEAQEGHLKARERENAARRAEADAEAAELKSREHDVEAKRLQAEAQDAQIAAERKRLESDKLGASAAEGLEESAEQLRRADKLDPASEGGKVSSERPDDNYADEHSDGRVDGGPANGPCAPGARTEVGGTRPQAAAEPVDGNHAAAHGDRAEQREGEEWTSRDGSLGLGPKDVEQPGRDGDMPKHRDQG